MDILFVSGNLCNGGAQRVISVVASSLAEKGHNVSLLLFSRNEKEYPISEKVKITSIGNSFEEYSKVSSLGRIKFFRKYLKELKPQVAIGFLEGGYALYLSSFGMKFSKVASARIDPQILMKQKGFRAKINRLWFKAADALVLQTESQKRHLPSKMLKKSVVIANPVSDKAMSVQKQSYNVCRNFVMAGRLDEQKNYPMVFRAVRSVKEKYPDIHIDIFGKGGEYDNLIIQISEMQIEDNVTLRGWSQNTIEEYSNHDAYILSSDCEGMPNALMEAMAVGLPCISTDCDTGPADLIEDGKSGYLIPVNDDKMLAKRMIKLIEMTSDERAELGKNARKTLSENFNSEAIAQKWEDLILKLKG